MACAAQEALRIATFNTELSRKGPGLLFRDIASEKDQQVEAVAKVIAEIQPDVILMQNVDFDYDFLTLSALRDRVAFHGHQMLHVFALPPNAGVATSLDMNGDGRIALPKDAQSFGDFEGQGGMAILSRYPIVSADVRDFSKMLWKDSPDANLPETSEGPFPSGAVQSIQRLSSAGHWVVPIKTDQGTLHLFAFHAGPPVFDGPEDRNGWRNYDEILLWRHVMDGKFGEPPAPFVILGNANLDPMDGEGRKEAILALLEDSRIQDSRPKRATPVPSRTDLIGDPNLHTVAWPDDGPGHKRVSYILPDTTLAITASGVYWPAEESPQGRLVSQASRHRLIWVDVKLPKVASTQ